MTSSIAEQIGIFRLVDAYALNRFLGAKSLVGFVASAQVAHLDLDDRCALARLIDFAFDDDPKLAVMLQHVARDVR